VRGREEWVRREQKEFELCALLPFFPMQHHSTSSPFGRVSTIFT
jgi:hypothetical protein